MSSPSQLSLSIDARQDDHFRHLLPASWVKNLDGWRSVDESLLVMEHLLARGALSPATLTSDEKPIINSLAEALLKNPGLSSGQRELLCPFAKPVMPDQQVLAMHKWYTSDNLPLIPARPLSDIKFFFADTRADFWRQGLNKSPGRRSSKHDILLDARVRWSLFRHWAYLLPTCDEHLKKSAEWQDYLQSKDVNRKVPRWRSHLASTIWEVPLPGVWHGNPLSLQNLGWVDIKMTTMTLGFNYLALPKAEKHKGLDGLASDFSLLMSENLSDETNLWSNSLIHAQDVLQFLGAIVQQLAAQDQKAIPLVAPAFRYFWSSFTCLISKLNMDNEQERSMQWVRDVWTAWREQVAPFSLPGDEKQVSFEQSWDILLGISSSNNLVMTNDLLNNLLDGPLSLDESWVIAEKPDEIEDWQREVVNHRKIKDSPDHLPLCEAWYVNFLRWFDRADTVCVWSEKDLQYVQEQPKLSGDAGNVTSARDWADKLTKYFDAPETLTPASRAMIDKLWQTDRSWFTVLAESWQINTDQKLFSQMLGKIFSMSPTEESSGARPALESKTRVRPRL